MSNPTQESRTAVARAEFLIEQADKCQLHERNEHEAFLEQAIVIGRAELHRLQSAYEGKPGWKEWWKPLFNDPAVKFLKEHRDQILKTASSKIGQTVFVGHEPPSVAHTYTYDDDPSIPAIEVVRKHIQRVREISQAAHSEFGS